MRVLVTGADGYIGVLLCSALLERGHEVVGVDAGFYSDGWLYEAPLQRPVRVQQDVRTMSPQALQGFAAVVHLAELSNDPLGQLNPAVTYEINYRGTIGLAERCKQAGIERFVYTSSCSVYGVGSDEYMFEESPTSPQTAYAHCKVLVEQSLRRMADDRFAPTILRNATAYGPSPRMRFDLVLNNLAGLAWTTREIKMTSDGTPWRPLVHVLDICEAVACVLEAPLEAVHNEVFNVGDSGQNFRVREIAETVAGAFPGCRVTFGTKDSDQRSYRVSFGKIRTHLPNFQPRRTTAQGAAELHEVFRSVALSRETFESKTFTRVKQLQYLLQSGRLDERLFWREKARPGVEGGR